MDQQVLCIDEIYIIYNTKNQVVIDGVKHCPEHAQDRNTGIAIHSRILQLRNTIQTKAIRGSGFFNEA